jgi:hypothetical protein
MLLCVCCNLYRSWLLIVPSWVVPMCQCCSLASMHSCLCHGCKHTGNETVLHRCYVRTSPDYETAACQRPGWFDRSRSWHDFRHRTVELMACLLSGGQMSLSKHGARSTIYAPRVSSEFLSGECPLIEGWGGLEKTCMQENNKALDFTKWQRSCQHPETHKIPAAFASKNWLMYSAVPTSSSSHATRTYHLSGVSGSCRSQLTRSQ